MRSRFIMARLSWNDHGWRRPDDRGAFYGGQAHESFNFDFDKPDLDTDTYVFGYLFGFKVPIRKFLEPGFVFFYAMDPNTEEETIVGIYGGAKQTYLKTDRDGFENGLVSNIVASRDMSLPFPHQLDAAEYKSGGQKDLAGHAGFAYVRDEDRAIKIISDEIALCERSDHPAELDKLYRIFETVAGRTYHQHVSSDETRVPESLAAQVESCSCPDPDMPPRADVQTSIAFGGPARKGADPDMPPRADVSTEDACACSDHKAAPAPDTGGLGISGTDDARGQDACCAERDTASDVARRDDGPDMPPSRTTAKTSANPADCQCQMCGISIKTTSGYYAETVSIGDGAELGSILVCPNHRVEFERGEKVVIQRTTDRIVFRLNGDRYDISLK